VYENISYGLKVKKQPQALIRESVEIVMQLMNLVGMGDRMPHQLSGGQQQRVALARALVMQPKVLLFDEPLSNLDAKLRVQMRTEIRQLHNRLGTTSVFVTHDQIEAMTLADRLVLMNGGRIEQVGSPSEIYAHPASAFVAGFIGAPPMNLLSARLDRSAGALRLPGDQSISMTPSQIDAIALDTVQIGIRPEALRPDFGSSDLQLKARFCFAEELGSFRLWHVDLSGVPLIVQTMERLPPGVDAVVTLGFEAADIHLFDADTGRRIEPECSG